MAEVSADGKLGRIVAEAIGIVDIFMSGEMAKRRSPELRDQAAAAVRSGFDISRLHNGGRLASERPRRRHNEFHAMCGTDARLREPNIRTSIGK